MKKKKKKKKKNKISFVMVFLSLVATSLRECWLLGQGGVKG